MRVPIFVDGDLAVDELAKVFSEAGYYLHTDSAGRLCASRVPSFLRHDSADNVVQMPKRRPGIRRQS